MKAMKANQIDVSDLDGFINDDDYDFTQKIDGDHVVGVSDGDGGVRILNKEGRPYSNPVPKPIAEALRLVPFPVIVDGELLDGQLWLFDLPQLGPTAPDRAPAITSEHIYSVRHAALAQFVTSLGSERIQAVPRYTGTDDKRWIAEEVERNLGEGIMIRRRDGIYLPGKRRDLMLKAKFFKELDAVITEVGTEGKDNCHFEVYDDGRPVDIGSAAMAGKPRVQRGQVATFRYIYAGRDHRLNHVSFIRLRDDKAPEDCTFDQLVYTNRTIILPKERA